jgi:predicted transcriptional regulator
MSRVRVTITVPEEVLEAVDRRAAELDRSRSRLIVDALRRYVAEPEVSAARVREPAATYVAGLGPGRLAQLEADLALTPEERVLLAQQTAAIGAERRRGAPLRHRVVVFDRIEDFFTWERREAIDL